MFSKWTYVQFLAVALLFGLFFIVEQSNYQLAITANSQRIDVLKNQFLISAFIFALFIWVYIMMFLQILKKPRLLDHQIWRNMPVISFGIGFISLVAFLILGSFGPLMEWVEQWRALLYVFITYFAFIFFIFIMSIIHKYMKTKDSILNMTLFWSTLVIIVSGFII